MTCDTIDNISNKNVNNAVTPGRHIITNNNITHSSTNNNNKCCNKDNNNSCNQSINNFNKNNNTKSNNNESTTLALPACISSTYRFCVIRLQAKTGKAMTPNTTNKMSSSSSSRNDSKEVTSFTETLQLTRSRYYTDS